MSRSVRVLLSAVILLALAGASYFATLKFLGIAPSSTAAARAIDAVGQVIPEVNRETLPVATVHPRPELYEIAQQYRRGTPTPEPGSASRSLVTTATAPLGAPPSPNQRIVFSGNPGKKRVALTFDDGPSNMTPKFIEILAEKKVKATFFLIGRNVREKPDLARELVARGFEVANHSWSHPRLPGLPVPKMHEEISSTTAEIEQATGAKVSLIRPPYGAANKAVLDFTDQSGLRVINWNIDTNDWRGNSTAQTMTNEIMKNLRDGSIILMHDRFEKSYQTTVAVIDAIRAKGYEFVTVSEILDMPPQVVGVPPAATALPAAAASLPVTASVVTAPPAP